MHGRIFIAGIVVLAMVASLATGCRARQFETDADALRSHILDLEDQVQRLERRERELASELRRTRAWAERREELNEEDIREFVPHVVDMSVGRLSHVRDRSGDGMVDTLVLYLHPIDSRGRFTQMVGRVIVNAVIVPVEEDTIPLARVQVGPGAIRDAYRSGITGTHYAIEVPFELPDTVDRDWLEEQQIVARVAFVDGQTGERHTAERVIAVQR